MNLFEFYRDAVTLWRQESEMGWSLSTAENHRLTNDVIPQFQDDCQHHDSLDYSEDDRRTAYGLHYAPKHAIVWREYLRNNPKSSLHSPDRLNSIGTGPGSELIGILEGSLQLPEKVELVCLEREGAWRPLLEIVLARYAKNRKIEISWLFTDDPKNLLVGAPVVGSCVLSELGREGRIGNFLSSVRTHVGEVRGRFLDFPRYPTKERTPFIEDMISGCRCVKIYEMNWGLCDILNREMNACKPCHCKVPQTKEPGMRMHLFRFK